MYCTCTNQLFCMFCTVDRSLDKSVDVVCNAMRLIFCTSSENSKPL